MTPAYDQFIAIHPNTVQDKPLAPLTTVQIGGPADVYYALTDINELPKLIETAKKLSIPYFVLGGGSNTIFHENGFRGLIIHIKAKNIEVQNNTIIADAGALLSQTLQAAIKNGLIGMEKFMGLPGTIGGAVRGNAGAFGIETKDVLQKVLLYNEEQGIHEIPATELNFAYRSSSVKAHKGRDIVLKAWYQLTPGDTKAAMKENAAVIAQRLAKQPAGKNTGSFFKNPNPTQSTAAKATAIGGSTTGPSAGKLLDEAGCKGLRIGDIQVSPQHANWIMNLGSATQTSVLELMKAMQNKVREKFNITLEPEVQFVSETGFLDPSAKTPTTHL